MRGVRYSGKQLDTAIDTYGYSCIQWDINYSYSGIHDTRYTPWTDRGDRDHCTKCKMAYRYRCIAAYYIKKDTLLYRSIHTDRGQGQGRDHIYMILLYTVHGIPDRAPRINRVRYRREIQVKYGRDNLQKVHATHRGQGLRRTQRREIVDCDCGTAAARARQ